MVNRSALRAIGGDIDWYRFRILEGHDYFLFVAQPALPSAPAFKAFYELIVALGYSGTQRDPAGP